MQEAKALRETIATYTTKKGVCERLIQMLSPKTVGASSSQATMSDVEKDVVTLDKDENMASANENVDVKYETKSMMTLLPLSAKCASVCMYKSLYIDI